MSETPTIFISHSSKDGHIANVLKEHLEAILDIRVFETSHFDAIEGGEKWFEVITHELDNAQAMLVVVSANSAASHWVHWETGYFHKRNVDLGHALPVFVATVGGHPPFNTIDDNQAKSLNNANETENLLKSIGKYFESDMATEYTWNEAVDAINQIAPIHISDESAIEKIKDYIRNEYNKGDWLDYAETDRKLRINSGTVRAFFESRIQENKLEITFLKDSPYQFEIITQGKSGIRFRGDYSFEADDWILA